MSKFVENKLSHSSWLTIKKVAPYLWPKQQLWVKRRVILALICLTLAKIVAVSTPFLFKAVVDGLASNGKSSDALMLLLGASGIVFAYGFFRLAKQRKNKNGRRIHRETSAMLKQHLIQGVKKQSVAECSIYYKVYFLQSCPEKCSSGILPQLPLKSLTRWLRLSC